MSQIKKRDLNKQQQQLIELMQSINFGRVLNISVVNGNPKFTSKTIIEREIKLAGQNGVRPEIGQEDFIIKKEVSTLLEHLSLMGNGTVRQLEIKHGLPFLLRIEERAA